MRFLNGRAGCAVVRTQVAQARWWVWSRTEVELTFKRSETSSRAIWSRAEVEFDFWLIPERPRATVRMQSAVEFDFKFLRRGIW